MALDVAQPGFATTVEAVRLHSWKFGPGRPTLVIDRFTDADFKLVVDDRADVHVNSKDGRFYLGWFPMGRPGTDGEGWVIAVTGTAKVRAGTGCRSTPGLRPSSPLPWPRSSPPPSSSE